MRNTPASGKRANTKGHKNQDFYKDFFSCLDNWKGQDPLVGQILTAVDLKSNQIESVSATTAVEALSSGGAPKTDLILTLNLIDKSVMKIRFSCKISSCRSVTFHEYSAAEFIKVLSPLTKKAQDLIVKHQADGSAINFSTAEKEVLRDELKGAKTIKLIEWVILGMHHLGVEAKDQIVDYVICNGTLKTISDYKDELATKQRGFGTGFSWTRQSRGKGKTIQLKGPVLDKDT